MPILIHLDAMLPKDPFIKRVPTFFLQAVLILIGIGTLAFLLWEPHLEGRNVDATLFEMYFKDPFLAYVYSASIAFFAALYQACRLLSFIRKNEVFSQDAAKAVRTIKYCSTLLAALIAAPLIYLLIARPSDDIAGGVVMGVFAMFVSVIVATVAAVLEGIVRSAMDGKDENLLAQAPKSIL